MTKDVMVVPPELRGISGVFSDEIDDDSKTVNIRDYSGDSYHGALPAVQVGTVGNNSANEKVGYRVHLFCTKNKKLGNLPC